MSATLIDQMFCGVKDMNSAEYTGIILNTVSDDFVLFSFKYPGYFTLWEAIIKHSLSVANHFNQLFQIAKLQLNKY